MARKKRAEEPENLERWLVSYGDFITLLFATFVVLYALAQVDVSDFAKLEESLKNAFSQNTLLTLYTLHYSVLLHILIYL